MGKLKIDWKDALWFLVIAAGIFLIVMALTSCGPTPEPQVAQPGVVEYRYDPMAENDRLRNEYEEAARSQHVYEWAEIESPSKWCTVKMLVRDGSDFCIWTVCTESVAISCNW